MKPSTLHWAALLAACAWPVAAHAQDSGEQSHARHGGGSLGEITPYIEAGQVFSSELEPGNDTVTYTEVAAGVDATIVGRNSAASASLRYERRFAWDKNAQDSDTVSGIARASVAVVPHAVTIEAGGLAERTRVDGDGGASLAGVLGNEASSGQLYSGYIGPSVHTMQGDVEIEGHYRFGYTKEEAPDSLVIAPGGAAADIFDESTVHMAAARVGTRPHTAGLPIGVGIGGQWDEQDISNLDQRIRDRNVRGDVTVPVQPDLALVGGIGYEDVEVSSRDALRDVSGSPVIDSHGRFVTDAAAPRRIAYQTDGLIWDAGVMWRPSRRTSLEAYVGRRYGETTYWGTFAWAPNRRETFNVVVYDSLTGFGGLVTDTLAALPSQFDAFRNPITGEIGGCVANTGSALGGQNCIAGALASVRSAVFRSRGVAASYGVDLGRVQFGVGGGYDRRQFIAAAGTVLAPANGSVDQSAWLAGYATERLDRQSTVSANAYLNWFQSGLAADGDTYGYSATLAYQRNFLQHLSGTAAIGLDGITRDSLPDFSTASALLGLRYSF